MLKYAGLCGGGGNAILIMIMRIYAGKCGSQNYSDPRKIYVVDVCQKMGKCAVKCGEMQQCGDMRENAGKCGPHNPPPSPHGDKPIL